MDWDLSPQQVIADERVTRWHEAHEFARQTGQRPKVPQVFRLFGSAGTGKSTLLKRLMSTVKGPTAAGAYTGKAASVMTDKGVPADTVHRLIYKPAGEAKNKLPELKAEERKLLDAIEKATGPDAVIRAELREVRNKIRMEQDNGGRPFFSLNPDSPLFKAHLCALDEVSMIDRIMGEDLVSFECPLLVLGDPFQLPPVRGTGYFTEAEPDVLLTEVHRQAEGSPILHLATLARLGRSLPCPFEQENEMGRAIVMRGRPDPEVVMAADQILCGRNDTRRAINRRVRGLLGYMPDLPVKGDKLVCLKNNRDAGLLNGTIWTVTDNFGSNETDRVLLGLADESGRAHPEVLSVHTAPFLNRDVPKFEMRDCDIFDYGYALTVHKSQGSQWRSVVLFDDWGGSDRARWLYTGVTRAAVNLLVAQ